MQKVHNPRDLVLTTMGRQKWTQCRLLSSHYIVVLFPRMALGRVTGRGPLAKEPSPEWLVQLWVALGRLGKENSWEQGLVAAVSRPAWNSWWGWGFGLSQFLCEWIRALTNDSEVQWERTGGRGEGGNEYIWARTTTLSLIVKLS